MKLTKATLKKMIKEELSSTRKRPVRRRRRRSLREAREGVTDDRGYKNFGPMEKKLFDRIESYELNESLFNLINKLTKLPLK